MSHTHTNNNNKLLKPNLKSAKVGILTNKEFKIAIMKKLNKLKENSQRQFSEFRNKINYQKG